MLIVLLLFAFLTPTDDLTPEEHAATQLAKVRRIYVDILTGGDTALKIRDLLMTSLQCSKQFVITEDADRADAVLRGAGDDKIFTETFQSSEGLNAHSQIGGSLSGGTKSTRSPYLGVTVGENDNRKTEERKHEAMATVRLINKDGDVIWSATAESLGGKFLGASADVAEKLAKRLVTDYREARRTVQQKEGSSPPPAPPKSTP